MDVQERIIPGCKYMNIRRMFDYGTSILQHQWDVNVKTNFNGQ